MRAHTGPGDCPGCGGSGRDDPRSVTASLGQDTIGLSRPWVPGILPLHKLPGTIYKTQRTQIPTYQRNTTSKPRPIRGMARFGSHRVSPLENQEIIPLCSPCLCGATAMFRLNLPVGPLQRYGNLNARTRLYPGVGLKGGIVVAFQ